MGKRERFVSLEEARKEWKRMDEEKKDKKKWKRRVYKKKIYVVVDRYCRSLNLLVPVKKKRTVLRQLQIDAPINLEEIVSNSNKFLLCNPKCTLHNSPVGYVLDLTFEIRTPVGDAIKLSISNKLGIPKEDIDVQCNESCVAKLFVLPCESPCVAKLHVKATLKEPIRYDFQTETLVKGLDNKEFQSWIDSLTEMLKEYMDRNIFSFLESSSNLRDVEVVIRDEISEYLLSEGGLCYRWG